MGGVLFGRDGGERGVYLQVPNVCWPSSSGINRDDSVPTPTLILIPFKQIIVPYTFLHYKFTLRVYGQGDTETVTN